MTIPYDIGPDCHPSGRPFRNVFPRPATAPADGDSSFTVLIGKAAKGERLTELEQDALRRELLRMKKSGNVSWAAIGSVYGLSGPEMRRVRGAVLVPAKHGSAS